MVNRTVSESFDQAISDSTSPNWVEKCDLSSFRGNCFPGEDTRAANRDVSCVTLSNGDRFNLSPMGWSLRDRNGKTVERVRQIDNGQIPGNSEYLLSNGARYHSGCFSDSIEYPNGDSISWSRSGKILSSTVARNEGRAASAGNDLVRRAAEVAADSVSGACHARDVTRELGLLAAKLACGGFLLKLENSRTGRDIAFSNGDHFRVRGDGHVLWTDSYGRPIRQVRRIDNDMIPGNVTYEMSNGAKHNSGCFADNITYPNGDTISYSRSGTVMSAVVRGRRLI